VVRPQAGSRNGVMGCRNGFGLIEVIAALVVFAIGAIGAAGLTAHAARVAVQAQRREVATLHAGMLLDSLLLASAPSAGTRSDPVATYTWTADVDTTGRRIRVDAVVGSSPDTIRLEASRPPLPPVFGTW